MTSYETSKLSVLIDGLLSGVFWASVLSSLLLILFLSLIQSLLTELVVTCSRKTVSLFPWRNAPMKMDKSSKVGGRRKAGPAAKKSSMAKGPKGRKITHTRGHSGYHGR